MNMTQQDLKDAILEVLAGYQDSQLNIKSESLRNILAWAISDRIIQENNIKLAIIEKMIEEGN